MRIAILGAALTLAACGGADEPPREPAASKSPTAPALEEMSEADLVRTDLEGELACAFRAGEKAAPLFLGRGNVLDDAGARGAVKYEGTVRTLAMDGTGGYDAMADGARFEGEGLALTIATSSDEPLAEEPQVAMESPIYPATLTFSPAGQPAQTIEGLFECGP